MTQPETIVEQNKKLIRWAWNGIFNEMDPSICDKVIALDYTYQGQHPAGSAPDSVKAFATAVHEAYPDVYFDTLDVLGDGDKVAIRYTVTGHHSGTNKLMSTMATNILTLKDGQVNSNWQTGGTMETVDDPHARPESTSQA